MPSALPQDDGASVFLSLDDGASSSFCFWFVFLQQNDAASQFAAGWLCQYFYFCFVFFCQKIMEKDYVATLVFPENDAASVYFAFMART